MDYMHKDVVGVGVNAWMLPLVGEASSLVGGHPRACMRGWGYEVLACIGHGGLEGIGPSPHHESRPPPCASSIPSMLPTGTIGVHILRRAHHLGFRVYPRDVRV